MARGWTNAAEIKHELERRFPAQDPAKVIVPNLRTIQRVLGDFAPRDDTTWSLADADAEDAALVLPVLAAMVEESEGRRQSITQREARWILKIRRADLAEPGERLDHVITYELAFDVASYSADPELREFAEAQVAYVVQFLAFAPWRSAEHEKRYYAAFEKGWLGWRFMVHPLVYFTNDMWPKPLPAGDVGRENAAGMRNLNSEIKQGGKKNAQTRTR